mgnify:CR=1 FL=1
MDQVTLSIKSTGLSWQLPLPLGFAFGFWFWVLGFAFCFSVFCVTAATGPVELVGNVD